MKTHFTSFAAGIASEIRPGVRIRAPRPRGRRAEMPELHSVFRWLGNVIDDQKFDRSFLGLQLQAQLLL